MQIKFLNHLKKWFTIIIVAILCIAAVPIVSNPITTNAATSSTFTDISELSENIQNAINWASSQGIVNGYSDGTFKPYNDCTRQEAAIMFYRLAGWPTVTTAQINTVKSKFSDVSSLKSTGAIKAIAWAYNQGLISGYSDGTFRPTTTITRDSVIVMLYRLAGKPATTTTNSFSDISGCSAGVKKAINWASSTGIAHGTANEDGTYSFQPTANCQRYQIATFFYRYKNPSISIEKNNDGWWYCKNGIIDTTYNGTYTYDNATLYFTNGKVTSMYSNSCEAGTSTLSGYIQTNNIKHLEFVPFVFTGNYIDVSAGQGKYVRAWRDGDTLYVGPSVYGGIKVGDFSTLSSCSSLETANVRWVDTSHATSLAYEFHNCYNLKEIKGLEYWDTSHVTNMSNTFAMGNPNIHNGGCSGIVTYNNGKYTCSKCGTLSSWSKSRYSDNAAITDLSGINNWNVSNVTNMEAMFYGDKYLTNIDLSHWNTGNVRSFCHTFCRCDLSDEIVSTFKYWDTHNVNCFAAMFVRGQFTTFDMSHWNTSNAVDMAEMFGYCSKLVNTNFTNVNTSKCKSFDEFFIGCKSLQYVDIRSFSTASIPTYSGYLPLDVFMQGTGGTMGYVSPNYGFTSMFEGCTSLIEVDVTNGLWVIKSGMDTTNMWLSAKPCNKFTYCAAQ